MRYVIRERIFRLGEDSDITDEQGRRVYHVDGKVLTLHNTLVVRDRVGTEVDHPDQCPRPRPRRGPGAP